MKRARKIVAAVDLSDATPAVVDAAADMAQALHGDVDVLHVREPFTYATTGGEIPVERQPALAHDFVDDALARISDRLNHAGVTCVTSRLEGSATSEIVSHADRTGADLIVVGTTGHGRGHGLLGSVAERVLRRASRPVLVVPVRAAEP